MINETAWVIVDATDDILGHTLADTREMAWDFARFGSFDQKYYEKHNYRAVRVAITEIEEEKAI